MDDRLAIYSRIKALLSIYSPPLVARSDFEGRYELWSEKAIEVEGRKRKEVYFGGLIIQSSYVGFYYMPVYAQSEMATLFRPELLARLKGKSCFHITKLDDTLEAAIREALELGWRLYIERGWV